MKKSVITHYSPNWRPGVDLKLTYSPTKSMMECSYSEDDTIIIEDVKSEREGEGGFSILLSELEKIATRLKRPNIILQVSDRNKAVEKYQHKGFKVEQCLPIPEKNQKILFMQKTL